MVLDRYFLFMYWDLDPRDMITLEVCKLEHDRPSKTKPEKEEEPVYIPLHPRLPSPTKANIESKKPLQSWMGLV